MPRAARSVATTTCTLRGLEVGQHLRALALAQHAVEGLGVDAGLAQLVGHDLRRMLGGDEDQHARPALCAATRWRSSCVRRAGIDLDRALQDGGLVGRLGLRPRCAPGRAAARRPATATAGGKVAENSRFCRCAGSSARMRPSSSAKPRSNRRSASSSTSIDTVDSFSARWSTRSSRRPGVATMMSAPPRSAIICGLMETPPNSHRDLERHRQVLRQAAHRSRRPAPPARASAPGPARAAGAAVPRRSRRQPLQQRQREGRRLAGAGLGRAQHVAALQDRRDGGGLDRRWARHSPCRRRRAPGQDRGPES